jgi:hypothetical protein
MICIDAKSAPMGEPRLVLFLSVYHIIQEATAACPAQICPPDPLIKSTVRPSGERNSPRAQSPIENSSHVLPFEGLRSGVCTSWPAPEKEAARPPRTALTTPTQNRLANHSTYIVVGSKSLLSYESNLSTRPPPCVSHPVHNLGKYFLGVT